MAIDAMEANALAEAFCKYAAHTNLTINPRTADLVSFMMIAAAIEGPRLARVSARRKRERSERQVADKMRADSTSNVVGIGPLGPGVRGI